MTGVDFRNVLEEVLYDFDGGGYLSDEKREEYATRLLDTAYAEVDQDTFVPFLRRLLVEDPTPERAAARILGFLKAIA